MKPSEFSEAHRSVRKPPHKGDVSLIVATAQEIKGLARLRSTVVAPEADPAIQMEYDLASLQVIAPGVQVDGAATSGSEGTTGMVGGGLTVAGGVSGDTGLFPVPGAHMKQVRSEKALALN